MKLRTKLALAMGASLLLLAGCKATSTAKAKDDGKTSIGILQLVAHPSLDASYEGFKDALKAAGYEEGKNLTLDYQNAQNSQDNLKSMSEKLVKEKPDLLLGIATNAAQALANETTEIPIAVTAVTDLEAAKLVKSNEKPGANITGTSDMVPIDKQIDLLLSIVPKAKTIGLIYNAGEANSKVQADLAAAAIKKAGLKVKTVTVNSTNDVQQAMTTLVSEADGIYVPTDNTLASSAALVGETAKEAKIPVVAGAIDQVKDGGLATVGLDYYNLGKQTGEMAVKILKGEAKPATMAVETAQNLELYVNEDMAKALDIDPASIVAPK